MKFKLNGKVIFNKKIEEAEEDIKTFIDEANNEILIKGTNEDQKDKGAHITNWNISDNDLNLEIISGYKVRAHDGLLRIKNPLTQLLGKKYHMGVRGIYIDNYEIAIPTGKDGYEFNKETAESLEDINNIEINEDNVVITMKDIDEGAIKKQTVNRIIKLITNKKEIDGIIADEGDDITSKIITKFKPGETVFESPKFKTYFEGDVTEKAIELGWIKSFPGRGQWFYGPEITALQRVLEEILLEEVIEKLDFHEALFPKLIPLETMNKMRYLDGLPEGMYYCSPPKRDPELFNKFKNELAINREIPMELLKKGLKNPGYVLGAAQCEPFYEFLSHEVIDKKELPIKLYDKSGWTYRWESGGAKGIDRVHEFQRIETVWLSTPEEVNKIRDQTLELSQELANKLELEWYTEIGDDPFYLEGRKAENRGIEFPEVPKYEMRLKVPGQDKGVAVVSANVHGTHFIQGFSIKEAHGEKIWTGCTGFGLTRWIFGVLAQKGFDDNNWPKIIKDRIKSVKSPKILTWP
ncbi:serine--tRNA ligase [Methanobrevibacter filiformis]|uniref:Serine--tRNA ligase n=1 Tax=Methanobrevibacter filiformis TaxID=55758 RepID=A0A166ESL0_9EURY|nr:serine--tRNA ligase [Methanobrevibacter filiformis]KZX16963.1 amino acid--[acyl-carrier-protein] ligase 1 [Methanobrevibacter filiformis]